MATLSPSFYLTQLENKRKRSADLTGGLGTASSEVLGGLDMLTRLQNALEEKKNAKEAKEYGRSINDRNQNRADVSAKLADELKRTQIDIMRQKAGLTGTAMDNPEVRSILERNKAEVEAETPQENRAEGGVEEEMPPPEGNLEIKSRLAQALQEWGPSGEKIDSESMPGVSTVASPPSTKDLIDQERLRGVKLRNEALERKAKGGGGKPSEKELKARADREMAEMRRDKMKKANEPGALTTAAQTSLQEKRAAARESRAHAQFLRDEITKYGLDQYAGPLDSIAQYLETKAGVKARDAARVQASIVLAAQQHRKAMTGTAANATEMREGQKVSIDLATDNAESALGKLDSAEAWTTKQEDLYNQELGEAPAAAPAPPPSVPSFSDVFGHP